MLDYSNDVEGLFVEMMERNCQPNEVTFDMLVRFFCRGGMVERAIQVL
jgi:hypothetical protein